MRTRRCSTPKDRNVHPRRPRRLRARLSRLSVEDQPIVIKVPHSFVYSNAECQKPSCRQFIRVLLLSMNEGWVFKARRLPRIELRSVDSTRDELSTVQGESEESMRRARLRPAISWIRCRNHRHLSSTQLPEQSEALVKKQSLISSIFSQERTSQAVCQITPITRFFAIGELQFPSECANTQGGTASSRKIELCALPSSIGRERSLTYIHVQLGKGETNDRGESLSFWSKGSESNSRLYIEVKNIAVNPVPSTFGQIFQ